MTKLGYDLEVNKFNLNNPKLMNEVEQSVLCGGLQNKFLKTGFTSEKKLY